MDKIIDFVQKNEDIIILIVLVVFICYYSFTTVREGLEVDPEPFYNLVDVYKNSNNSDKTMYAKMSLESILQIMECQKSKKLNDYVCLSQNEMNMAKDIDNKDSQFYKVYQEIKKLKEENDEVKVADMKDLLDRLHDNLL